jgi:hypothetical protein
LRPSSTGLGPGAERTKICPRMIAVNCKSMTMRLHQIDFCVLALKMSHRLGFRQIPGQASRETVNPACSGTLLADEFADLLSATHEFPLEQGRRGHGVSTRTRVGEPRRTNCLSSGRHGAVFRSCIARKAASHRHCHRPDWRLFTPWIGSMLSRQRG